MGNAGFRCADAGFRCAEQCKRISRHDAFVAETPFGGCDPAGAVFEETLQDLSNLDRQLILFASSSNVIAVRWLLEINASIEARDTNWTTCLHAACRSGSQLVVTSLLETRRKAERVASTLDAADVSGWTPLHISVFMGRPDVCSQLLDRRASLDRRNLVGQTPVELCSDARTRAVLLGTKRSVFQGSTQRRNDDIVREGNVADGYSAQGTRRNLMEGFEQALQNGSGAESLAGQALSPLPEERCEVHFEPFFVPRPPVIRDPYASEESKEELKNIGQAIFKRQPGRGLAFLVASGCTRDYPIDLVALLRGNDFDVTMIGTFLGEDFSLSKILRMEFINSISLVHAGIVQSLNKAFANFSAPYDFRKVDRILASLAEVWWRQHLREPPAFQVTKATMPQQPCQTAVRCPTPDHDEGAQKGIGLESVEEDTMEENEDSDSASFTECGGSTISQPPLRSTNGVVDKEIGGFDLRRCLSGPGLLHQMMFSAMMLCWNQHDGRPDAPVSLEQWLELNNCLDLPASTAADILTPIYTSICRSPLPNSKMVKAGGQLDQQVGTSAVQGLAQVEGWARILGDAMPLIGPTRNGGTAMDVWQLFSEATASSRRTHPDNLPGRPMRVGVGSSSPASIGKSPIPRSSVPVQRQDAATSGVTSAWGPDALWLSLCNYFLFFSVAKAEGSPFAFIPLAKVHFASIEPAHSTLALDGGPDLASLSAVPKASPDFLGGKVEDPLLKDSNGHADSRAGSTAARLPLVLIFLLPDGRWQTFEVPQLVIQVCDKTSLEAWVLRLSELASMGPDYLVP